MLEEVHSVQQRVDMMVERHMGVRISSFDTVHNARNYPLTSLVGRKAVITGASSGIGRSIAELFAIHGANLVIHGRNKQNLESLAEVTSHMAVRTEIVVGDTSLPETALAIGEAVRNRFDGKIDILVNNAGSPNDKAFDKTTPKSWGEFDEAIAANLTGPLRITSSIYRGIQGAGPNGRIISIGSVSGEHGNVGQTLYAASKAGIAGATKSWAAELLQTGGTANIVAYGPVETQVWDKARDIGRRWAKRAGGDAEADPLQPIANRMISRRFTTPEEAARPVLYLASDMGSQTTRQLLIVDGGITTLSLA